MDRLEGALSGPVEAPADDGEALKFTALLVMVLVPEVKTTSEPALVKTPIPVKDASAVKDPDRVKSRI
jgi:hypothetical protein